MKIGQMVAKRSYFYKNAGDEGTEYADTAGTGYGYVKEITPTGLLVYWVGLKQSAIWPEEYLLPISKSHKAYKAYWRNH